MAQTNVLHISDPHLSSREDGADIWSADFAAAFERAVDVAIERDVDAVVHTGDRFDDPRPALPTITRWADTLDPLHERDVPVFAIGGDRDRIRDDQWVDTVRRSTAVTRLGREPRVVANTALYGIDAVRPSEWQSTDFTLERPPPGADWTILYVHELLEPPGDAAVGPLVEDVLDRVGIDVDGLALGGRLHAPSARLDGTDIWGEGQTGRVETDQTTAGFVDLLTIEDGTITRQRLDLETRPVVAPTITFGRGEGIDRVGDVLGRHHLSDAVATIELVLEDGAVTGVEATRLARDAGVAAVDLAGHGRATDERAIERLQPAQNAVETAALQGFRRRSGRETAPAARNVVETRSDAGADATNRTRRR